MTFFSAVLKGNKESVEFLLLHAANPDFPARDGGRTPLHLACRGDQKEIVQILLLRGADTKARAKDGNDWWMVEKAADRGDKSVASISGITPLHYASAWGTKEIVLLLLEKDAPVNAKDEAGNTPLSVAGKRGRREIVMLLSSQGAVER